MGFWETAFYCKATFTNEIIFALLYQTNRGFKWFRKTAVLHMYPNQKINNLFHFHHPSLPPSTSYYRLGRFRRHPWCIRLEHLLESSETFLHSLQNNVENLYFDVPIMLRLYISVASRNQNASVLLWWWVMYSCKMGLFYYKVV